MQPSADFRLDGDFAICHASAPEARKCAENATYCDKEAERAHDAQAQLSFRDAAASWRDLARHWLELAGENSE
jgi:hypothetical protein